MTEKAVFSLHFSETACYFSEIVIFRQKGLKLNASGDMRLGKVIPGRDVVDEYSSFFLNKKKAIKYPKKSRFLLTNKIPKELIVKKTHL